MAAPMSFDVLVVGSGASGLAAALSAERAGARVALVAKDSVQSCNSAKAQGGIQAAFGDDDAPEIHAEDVWRSSHETADRRLVEVLTGEARDLDALQYHPNGGAWPATMQGYSIPETTRAYGATLLNAEREEFTDPLGPRDEVSQAIFDEVAAGRGVETPDGRAAVYLDTTRIPEADANVSLPYMLRRYRAGGVDPLQEPILTYPVLHYQNGGVVVEERGGLTRAAFAPMREQRYGRLVFTTSGRAMSKERTRPGLAAYAVGKMAHFALMVVAAAEGEQHGILANAIAPAARTRMLTRSVAPGELEPEQVAPGVLFLASERCGFSGKVLEAGGGEFDVP